MSITQNEIDQARQDGVEAARRIEGAPNKFHPSCPLHRYWAEGFQAGQQEPRDINGVPIMKGDLVQISDGVSIFGEEEPRDQGLLGIIGIVCKVDGTYGFLTRLCTGHYVRLLGHEVCRVGQSSCPEQTQHLFANITSVMFKVRTAIDKKRKLADEDRPDDLAGKLIKYRPQIDAFRKRRADPPKRVDNSALPAGSPMIYYCQCGHVKAVMPEEHRDPVPRFCEECDFLNEAGLFDMSGEIKTIKGK